MRSPSSPAPLPPTTCQMSRTWVPSRRDSPRNPGLAMVPAHRTQNPDGPAAALATGQAYSAAGLIPSRLSWVWTCPPLVCCHRLLPHPSQGHPALAARGRPGGSHAALWVRGAGSATWRKERVSAVKLSRGHARVNAAEGRDSKSCPLSSSGGGAS